VLSDEVAIQLPDCWHQVGVEKGRLDARPAQGCLEEALDELT
jgi:hypothetical protein